MVILASTSHSVDNAIFRVAEALEVPVLILALIALAIVIFELGTFIVEIRSRWGRRADLEAATMSARKALLADDRDGARHAVAGVARSASMARALSAIVTQARLPGADHRLGKALADFDIQSQSRLARTRLLVRAGPALGLMGTLIPLAPALTGLAQGDVGRLSSNLRIAFSVTVLGLLVGAVAFGLSLYRDRMYGQDLSDLEYVAAIVNDPGEIAEVQPPPDLVVVTPAPEGTEPATIAMPTATSPPAVVGDNAPPVTPPPPMPAPDASSPSAGAPQTGAPAPPPQEAGSGRGLRGLLRGRGQQS